MNRENKRFNPSIESQQPEDPIKRKFLKQLGALAGLSVLEFSGVGKLFGSQEKPEWHRGDWGAEKYDLLTQERADDTLEKFFYFEEHSFPTLKKLFAFSGHKVDSPKIQERLLEAIKDYPIVRKGADLSNIDYEQREQKLKEALKEGQIQGRQLRDLLQKIESGTLLHDSEREYVANILSIIPQLSKIDIGDELLLKKIKVEVLKNNFLSNEQIEKLNESILRYHFIILQNQIEGKSPEYQANVKWAAAYYLDTIGDGDTYTFTKELTNELFENLSKLRDDPKLNEMQKNYIKDLIKTLDIGKRGDVKTLQQVAKFQHFPLPIDKQEKDELLYNSLNCTSVPLKFNNNLKNICIKPFIEKKIFYDLNSK